MTSETKTIIAIAVGAIAIFIAIIAFGSSTTPPNTEVIAVENPALQHEDSRKIVAPNQKVTLIEFGDFQCPSCAAAHPYVKQLKEEYKDTLTFIFRHRPLVQHPYAELASRAAEAAGEQDKFWEMHDKLFDNQNAWSVTMNAEKAFIGYAEDLGLDVEKFKTDLGSEKIIKRIQFEKSEADALGATSTPTFYVNDAKYTGDLGYDSLKQAIDKAISGS
jgi:protein-disulfide isomerase